MARTSVTEYQPVIRTTSGVVSSIARPISGTLETRKRSAVNPVVVLRGPHDDRAIPGGQRRVPLERLPEADALLNRCGRDRMNDRGPAPVPACRRESYETTARSTESDGSGRPSGAVVWSCGDAIENSAELMGEVGRRHIRDGRERHVFSSVPKRRGGKSAQMAGCGVDAIVVRFAGAVR